MIVESHNSVNAISDCFEKYFFKYLNILVNHLVYTGEKERWDREKHLPSKMKIFSFTSDHGNIAWTVI